MPDDQVEGLADEPSPGDIGGADPAVDSAAVDEFDGLVLDERFVRGGAYEPPARTREAIARYGDNKTSWRHGGGLHQHAPTAKAARGIPTAGQPRRGARNQRLISWLPAIAAIAVVTLVVAFGSHLGL